MSPRAPQDPLPPEFLSLKPADLRRRLLAWYRRRARDLPWRRSRDAYAIWVSEVMLQQTQVATVIPYFHRFLAAFPNLARLAAAPEEDVLASWQGLGYYRRARALHRAARRLAALGLDQLPDDPQVLAELPGLGRYTYNAILSQAFDRPLPIIEANSRRVLARLTASLRPVDRGPGERMLWRVAEALLPSKGAGEFNQALMELGALVCTPQRPDCDDCPWRACCPTKERGWQDRIPAVAERSPVTEVPALALLIRRADAFFVVRRPAEGRWGGLWEFPYQEQEVSEDPGTAATRLLADLGLRAEPDSELLRFRFGVTRFRIHLAAWSARFLGGRFRPGRYPEGRWLGLEAIGALPLSSPQRRLVRALTGTVHKPLF